MARRKKRFQRARTIVRHAKHRTRKTMGGIGKRFNIGQSARGAAVLFIVDKAKSVFGLRIGSPAIDDDIDMIISGLVDKKSGYFVPAGTAKLIKDVADGFLGTQTIGLPFAGSIKGGYVGD